MVPPFECFQNWYLGDVFYRDTYHDEPYNVGKKGFLQCEVPLGGAAETKAMFRELKRRGYRLAIGTGRAAKEVEVPFKTYDWLTEFDADHIATETDVKKRKSSLAYRLISRTPSSITPVPSADMKHVIGITFYIPKYISRENTLLSVIPRLTSGVPKPWEP